MLAPLTLQRRLYRSGSDFRIACWNAFHHNAFGNAKAAAYSAVLSLFPALLAVTTLLTLAPDAPTFLGEIRFAFGQILPPDTMLLVQNYFEPTHGRSLRLILIASSITLFASMGLMLSLMEGFRRAYLLPRDAWRFWHQRLISALLVPGTLVPMIFATILVAFGHAIEHWMIQNADHELRSYVLLFWRIIRWTIALSTSILVLGVIYHFGIPRRLHWRRSLPGAILSTAAWFFATLLYGWYVTRFAHYRLVYGSLGAVVATMVWLYIVSFTILIGAEFNAQRSGIHPSTSSRPLSPCLREDLPIASPREHHTISIE